MISLPELLDALSAAWPDAYFGLMILFVLRACLKQENRITRLECLFEVERTKRDRAERFCERLLAKLKEIARELRAGRQVCKEALDEIEAIPSLREALNQPHFNPEPLDRYARH